MKKRRKMFSLFEGKNRLKANTFSKSHPVRNLADDESAVSKKSAEPPVEDPEHILRSDNSLVPVYVSTLPPRGYDEQQHQQHYGEC